MMSCPVKPVVSKTAKVGRSFGEDAFPSNKNTASHIFTLVNSLHLAYRSASEVTF